MDQRGYRQYYFTLRLNERMVIHSKVGTTWLAYDKQNRYDMRLNNRYNFLVLHKHLGKKLSVVITTRRKILDFESELNYTFFNNQLYFGSRPSLLL